MATEEPSGERLQKALAQAGCGSRRQIEALIRAGRISVNGRPAELGVRVKHSDRIVVDGRTVVLSSEVPRRRVLAYYKPPGEVTTRSDPQQRPTVFERLPKLRSGRWLSVGRLDLNTQGLLLLTNDGGLAQQLSHPSSQIEREYAVRVLGEADRALLQRLRSGVQLDDGEAHFEQLREAGGSGANRWYHVTLREGRNREVRRLWESQGLTVSRLVRVRFGPIPLRRGLLPGRYDELDADALALLLQAAGLPAEPKAPQRRRNASRQTTRPRSGHGRARGATKPARR